MALDFLKSNDNDSAEVIDDDFVELDAEMSEETKEVVIQAVTLKEFNDTEIVQDKLRDDEIVWVNIKPLKKRNMTDLKRAVKRMKKTVKAVDGDMAGVDEDWIVVCPAYGKIARTGDKVSEE